MNYNNEGSRVRAEGSNPADQENELESLYGGFDSTSEASGHEPLLPRTTASNPEEVIREQLQSIATILNQDVGAVRHAQLISQAIPGIAGKSFHELDLGNKLREASLRFNVDNYKKLKRLFEARTLYTCIASHELRDEKCQMALGHIVTRNTAEAVAGSSSTSKRMLDNTSRFHLSENANLLWAGKLSSTVFAVAPACSEAAISIEREMLEQIRSTELEVRKANQGIKEHQLKTFESGGKIPIELIKAQQAHYQNFLNTAKRYSAVLNATNAIQSSSTLSDPNKSVLEATLADPNRFNEFINTFVDKGPLSIREALKQMDPALTVDPLPAVGYGVCGSPEGMIKGLGASSPLKHPPRARVLGMGSKSKPRENPNPPLTGNESINLDAKYPQGYEFIRAVGNAEFGKAIGFRVGDNAVICEVSSGSNTQKLQIVPLERFRARQPDLIHLEQKLDPKIFGAIDQAPPQKSRVI